MGQQKRFTTAITLANYKEERWRKWARATECKGEKEIKSKGVRVKKGVKTDDERANKGERDREVVSKDDEDVTLSQAQHQGLEWCTWRQQKT